MPKINRVRIINFTYNNDVREIQDEIYSFFDGENVLLNLHNGGGKSVLIQLMLQPIIPNLTIQKRSMSDFFCRNSNPSYIMIEWLLDNEKRKDYLMTGIAIAPKMDKINENSNGINYFTFASHYDIASEFDIALVPFALKEGNRLSILPFERAREAVRKLANNHREMYYYSKDDSSEYKRLLTDFGISQEEWKNIIARMNNDEGGISELFEKCNTADSVFNEWIIKTIEKAILSDDSNEAQIQDLLEGLVADTINNEENIENQKIMKEYFEVHKELEDLLEKACNQLESLQNSKNDLNRMSQCLNRDLQTLELDLQDNLVQKEELEEKRIAIDKEEISENYYIALEKLDEANEQIEEIKEQLELIQREIEQKKYEEKCQNAAKLYTNFEVLRGDLNAISLKLEKIKGNDDINKRIDDLKYSLKIHYENKKDKLNNQVKKVKEEICENEQSENGLFKKVENYDKELEVLIQAIGRAEGEVESFEAKEEKMFVDLKITIKRNILKELDKEDVNAILKTYFDGKKQCNIKQENVELRLNEIANRKILLLEQKELILSEKINCENKEDKYKNDKYDFEEKEKVCNIILDKYEMERELLYRNDDLQMTFQKHEEKIETQKYALSLKKEQVSEMIKAIDKGRIYLPESILTLFEENDISYQTGEMYLGNLAEENRKVQLQRNPLLPFSVVIKKQDMDKLGRISFEQAFFRQIIPIFSYEQLERSFIMKNQLVQINEEVALISSYESRLFVDEEKQRYLEELYHKEYELVDVIQHLNEELSNIRSGKSILYSFKYDEDYYSNMMFNIEEINKQLIKCKEKQDSLNVEATELNEEEKDKELQKKEVTKKLETIDSNIQRFEDFLKKDEAFQFLYYQLSDNRENKIKIDSKKREANIEKDELRTKSNRLKEEGNQLFVELNNVKDRLIKYANSTEADIICESIDSLEKEYENLIKEQELSVKELEEDYQGKKVKYEEISEELEDLNIEETVYKSVKYDKVSYKAIAKMIKELERNEKEARVKENNRQKIQTLAAYEVERVNKRINEYGMQGPLSKNVIQQNYANRRKEIKFQLVKLDEKRTLINDKKALDNRLIDRINDRIEIKYVTMVDFKLEENIELQFNRLIGEYKTSEHNYEVIKKQFVKKYDEVKANYKDKHQCISDILNSVNMIDFDEKEITYEKLYFYLEEFMKKRESLNKLLEFYASKLDNMENTKRQVIDQCVSYANLIYEDVKRISSNSRIRLNGKSRLVQMLKLEVPTQLDNMVRSRMEEHINQALSTMVSIYKKDENKDGRKYKDKMKAFVSTRELLNQLVGTNKIPVSVYKVDLNEKNSGMKKWEDAMSQNSGGEKFVVFFTLVSTLISYTREVTRRNSGGDSMNESKVIIMDNPFARTSSEHLLKAVMDIAKTFNIQLICFSDLSQSSITNRFSLIYQLTIRKRMYSDKEVLKISNVEMNKDGLRENERLEHVNFYQKFEQSSMFDFIEEV